jgi:predicted DNA-binding protein YlxM (UPF0122 family)
LTEIDGVYDFLHAFHTSRRKLVLALYWLEDLAMFGVPENNTSYN